MQILVTRKRKKWANGTVSIGGMSSSASSDTSVDKSAIKAHRTFVEVVLGDSGAQPTKISEPQQQKLAAETTSRIEKLERLIALVGDDEPLAGHKASLERDLAAAKNKFPRALGTLQLRLRKSQSTFPVRRLVSNSSLRTLRKQNLFLRHAQYHFSGKKVVWPSCGRSSSQCLQTWMLTRQNSKSWNNKKLISSVCWQPNVVQLNLPRNRKLFKTFKPRSRRNVAGEQGNLLHFCVVSWNVAGIPLDDLDVWLQRVSDHFPWDLICLQEGFKRLNGVEIRGGHGVFTPCRQLGSLRSPAIIVRSGSACDDVVFLASDTRWLAVKSESMKMIFVSLHLPHRRISLVACTSIFTVLREALLGYRGAYRFVFGTDTNTHLWGCSDGRLIGNSVPPPLGGLSQKDADKLVCLTEFLHEFELRADNTWTEVATPTRRAWSSVKNLLVEIAEEESQMDFLLSSSSTHLEDCRVEQSLHFRSDHWPIVSNYVFGPPINLDRVRFKRCPVKWSPSEFWFHRVNEFSADWSDPLSAFGCWAQIARECCLPVERKVDFNTIFKTCFRFVDNDWIQIGAVR